jgi:hypothetical protein
MLAERVPGAGWEAGRYPDPSDSKECATGMAPTGPANLAPHLRAQLPRVFLKRAGVHADPETAVANGLNRPDSDAPADGCRSVHCPSRPL